MENPELNGVRAKIDRAIEHFNNLCLAINTRSAKFADKPIPSKFDANRRSFELIQEGHFHISDWALCVGDIVHNLRSSLDHLAVRLALSNKTTPEAATRTVFPLCLCRKEFRNSTKRFESLITPKALAKLERAQPYHTMQGTGFPAHIDILFMVSKLDDIDKHRMLVLIEEGYSITDVTLTGIDGLVHKPPVKPDVWMAMKDRAELFAVDFSQVPFQIQDEVDMQVSSTVDIFLNEPELRIGKPLRLRPFLRQSIGEVNKLVDDFGTDLFGE